MLCQFTFKNFKSYKNETVFDMQAVSSQGFTDSLLQSGDDRKTYLPVSVIYGPNAGGKSNVLDALNCVNALVMKPILIFKNKVIKKAKVEWTPFLFDDTSRNEPTEFELYFRPNNNYEYRYALKISNEIISGSFGVLFDGIRSHRDILRRRYHSECHRLYQGIQVYEQQ